MSDPSYQIFHSHWLCEVPDIFCYSDAYVREIGFITSGDKKIDAALRSAPRDIYLTIAAMITYYEEGAPIRFKSLDDVKSIHRLIIEHLRNWLFIVQTVIDAEAPPIEDFYRMDEFAQAIFPATIGTSDTVVKSELSARISVTQRGFKGLGGRLPIRTTTAGLSDAELAKPRHQSCINELATLLTPMEEL